MLQLARHGEGWVGHAAASLALPAGLPAAGPQRAEALARIIRQICAAGGFVGKRVVSCLPSAAIQYKNLRMPKMPPDEMAAAIQWEAADRFKVGADTMRIQYFDAGEVHQGEELRQEIIVLATPRTLVDEHLDTILRSDLKPDAIDAIPGALARSTVLSADAQSSPQMVLDLGYSASKVLITHQGRVAFFKVIDIGGQRLDQMVAQTLNLQLPDAADVRRRFQRGSQPDAQGAATGAAPFGLTRHENVERAVIEATRSFAGDLTKEIGLCVRYYSVTFRGSRPEVLRVVGGEAHAPRLAQLLAEGAGVQVDSSLPLSGIDLSPIATRGQTPGDLSEWAVAAGLALRTQVAQVKRSAA
jgi:type IV pilus assembly protein PilM